MAQYFHDPIQKSQYKTYKTGLICSGISWSIVQQCMPICGGRLWSIYWVSTMDSVTRCNIYSWNESTRFWLMQKLEKAIHRHHFLYLENLPVALMWWLSHLQWSVTIINHFICHPFLASLIHWPCIYYLSQNVLNELQEWYHFFTGNYIFLVVNAWKHCTVLNADFTHCNCVNCLKLIQKVKQNWQIYDLLELQKNSSTLLMVIWPGILIN